MLHMLLNTEDIEGEKKELSYMLYFDIKKWWFRPKITF